MNVYIECPMIILSNSGIVGMMFEMTHNTFPHFAWIDNTFYILAKPLATDDAV